MIVADTPIMPPLLEEELNPFGISNSLVGSSCENIVSGYLLSEGINISEPYVDFGVDLLIKMDDGWKRAQVKKVVKKLRDGCISFTFPFQRSGAIRKKITCHPIGPKEIDYFYHVLLTPLRQLIWQIPSNCVGLKKNGTFRASASVVLDRFNKHPYSKATIDFKSFLVDAKYNIKIFQEYPEFFNPLTLNNFIME